MGMGRVKLTVNLIDIAYALREAKDAGNLKEALEKIKKLEEILDKATKQMEFLDE